MRYQNSDQISFGKYITKLKNKLKTKDAIELQFKDFTQFDFFSDGAFEVSKEFISELAIRMERNELYSEPKIKTGVVKRAIDSPIVLYRGKDPVNYQSGSYKTGLLVLRIAVLMAKIDGDAAETEIDAIKNLIWNMAILSKIEKRCLYAKAIYLFSSNQKYDELARDYVRVALDRDILLRKIKALNPVAAGRVLTIAKDVAVADGFINRSELILLQDIYRVLDLPARSARSDLEKYANEKYIDLKTRRVIDYAPINEFEDIDDLLGDLLLEY